VRTQLAAALCFLVPLVLFWPATSFDFVTMDDPIYVYENPEVLGGLTADGISWAFSTTHGSIVAPLTWISYMIDVSASGTDAAGFHRTNVILHALNALLLFLLLSRATKSVVASALVALVFAVHPLRVESVAWITERKDVLSTAYLLGAMHVYVVWAAKPSMRRMLGVAGLMLAGLLAKPMVVVLPLLLLAFDHWPLRREIGLRARVIEKWPLFALSAAFALLTFFAHGRDGSAPNDVALGLGERLARIPVAYGFQFGKWVWPTDLVALVPDTAGVTTGWLLVGLIVLAGLIAAAFLLREKIPAVTAGATWFLLGLLPVTGVVTVGIAHLADRFGYVPGIGLAIALVFGVKQALDGDETKSASLQKAALGLGMIAVIALAVTTRPVLARWENSETLFRHAIETTGGNGYAYNYLGGWLAMQGERDEARRLLERAVDLDGSLVDAHANLAQLLLGVDDTRALRHASRAVELDPTRMTAQVAYGGALLRNGRLDNAIRAYERAAELGPGNWQPVYNLGQAYMLKGDARRAEAALRKALSLSPGNPRVLAKLRELRGG